MEEKIKICFLGDGAVGKTTSILQFISRIQKNFFVFFYSKSNFPFQFEKDLFYEEYDPCIEDSFYK